MYVCMDHLATFLSFLLLLAACSIYYFHVYPSEQIGIKETRIIVGNYDCGLAHTYIFKRLADIAGYYDSWSHFLAIFLLF